MYHRGVAFDNHAPQDSWDKISVLKFVVAQLVVKGGGKVDHVGGSTARLVAVENRTVLCLS